MKVEFVWLQTDANKTNSIKQFVNYLRKWSPFEDKLFALFFVSIEFTRLLRH